MAKIDSAVVAGGGVEILSALVNGAAAATDIPVPGFFRGAQVVACLRLEGSATYSAPTSLLGEVKAGTAPGKIQLETTDTTGDLLLLLWVQRA